MKLKILLCISLCPILVYCAERTALSAPLPMMEQGQTPEDQATELRKKRCIPCEGNVKPLSKDEEDDYMKAIPRWEIRQTGIHKLTRQFLFKNFKDSINFVNDIAVIAEEEGHHPNIEIFFNSVMIELYTHAISGLSENDFILAARIDEIAQKQRFGRKKK